MSGHSRRNFFRDLGKLGGGSLLSQVAIDPSRGRSVIGGDQRQRAAYELRSKAALSQHSRPTPLCLTNGDEARYSNLAGSYSKGFLHLQSGELDQKQGSFAALLYALSTGNHADFEKIPIGYVRKLVNIESALAFDMNGGDSHSFDMPAPPAFASARAAGEMVELYWQSLARDVPFTDWETSPIIQAAAADIGKLSDYAGPRDSTGQVTPANVFRGTTAGCLVGPYLSQYLLKTIYFGSTPREQMYRTGVVGADYLTDYSEWLQIQDGIGPYRPEVFDPTLRYIHTGRALAQFVHYDFTYQSFLQAALIIMDQRPETVLNFNLYQLNPTNPYKTSRVQTGFTTFGSAHVLDLLARVSNIGLQPACWYKWAIHRRIRPEAFGGRVFNHLSGLAKYPIHNDLLNSKALQATLQSTGLSLLPQAYVEGCPLHPSYPGGHAVIAGACATILKAFFDENALISSTVAPSRDGLSLVPADGLGLTIGGELHKLAFNVGMGRNFAGIHYRSDNFDGQALGEAVAISVLQDQVNCVSEDFAGFRFTKFDGSQITIAPNTR